MRQMEGQLADVEAKRKEEAGATGKKGKLAEESEQKSKIIRALYRQVS